MNSYLETIEINKRVVELIEEGEYLHAFSLLTNVTDQIISGVLSKAGLPCDLKPDMQQEAYIKFIEAVTYNFKPETCPVFITFWRVSLKNHLVALYSKQWRHKSIPEEYDVPRISAPNGILVQEIKDKLTERVNQWKGTPHEKCIALVLDVLEHRIFCLPDDTEEQNIIAKRHGKGTTVVHNWEDWLREEIRVLYS